MAIAGMQRWSLRLERAEVSRLTWAFSLSLAFHLAVLATYEAGNKYHVWQNLHWPAWLHAPKMLTALLKKQESQPPPPQQREIPLMFVNVNSAQATADAPKDAKFYSDKNARAANPEPDKITETPKIDGKRPEVVKTEDTAREKFAPLQPARAPQPAQEEQPEIKPKPAYTPGDLTMAKPSPTPRKDEGDANEAKPPRPRKVSELPQSVRDRMLPGEKMKLAGGVNRHAQISSVDTKATAFGAYDAALVDAISVRWYALLDDYGYAGDSQGKVVLKFCLHQDGRVTDMKEDGNTAGEMLGLLCQKAVLDPAPFAVWPNDMRRTLGDTRNIQFTFFY